MAERLIIVGESVRAAARSAVEAGFQARCVTVRAGRDLRDLAQVQNCPPDQFPGGVLSAMGAMPADVPVLLAAPMENHAGVVEAATFERAVLGSAAAAIRAVRDPMALPSLKPIRGIRYCETRTGVSLGRRLGHLVFGAFGRTKYLTKPRDSHGGVGIGWWAAGSRLGAGHYLQRYVRGEPYTAVFTSDGWSAQLLGVTETIVGDAAFGASGFRVCGHLGPVQVSEKARGALSKLGVQLAQSFDLRGVFSVDLVMDFKGVWWPVEVNPRFPDAAEPIERAEGRSVLMRSGGKGSAPSRSGLTVGVARVYARQDGAVPDLWAHRGADLGAHLTRDAVVDVPDPGTRVRTGEAVCTVIASDRRREGCLEALRGLAGAVYGLLGSGGSGGGGGGGGGREGGGEGGEQGVGQGG